jgi:hypothetical protein
MRVGETNAMQNLILFGCVSLELGIWGFRAAKPPETRVPNLFHLSVFEFAGGVDWTH